jgi:hypothetical protein
MFSHCWFLRVSFFTQLDEPRISGSRVAPRGGASYGLAVDLIGHGTMDQVKVLLAQDNVCFPGREQLRLGRAGYQADDWNECFDWQ